MSEELFIKYLTRQCSVKELLEVEQWIWKNPDNARRLFESERIMALKDEIHYANPKLKKTAWERIAPFITATYGSSLRQSTLNRYWYRVAAVVIVTLLALNLFRILSPQEPIKAQTYAWSVVYAPLGHRANIILPDGTRVSLNSGSVLRYPEQFSKEKQREVQLDGEALFEVQADTAHPFEVHTRLLNVQVLGTVFNVKAYPNEQVEVGLMRGKVEIESNNHVHHIRMVPKDLLTYSPSTGMALLQNQNLDNICAWTKGEIAYSNKSLQEICRDLERRFNVCIHISAPKLKQRLFTCHTIEKDITVETVLNLLKETTLLNYQKNNGTYLIVEK